MKDELEILLYGDPGLRRHCEPIVAFDDSLQRLVDGMVRAMGREGGIGLAAPQVGVERRLLVARDERNAVPRVITLVNPDITFRSQERDYFNEGCLSLPGITADVKRPVRVMVAYQDLNGNETQLEDDGLLARIIQHESDHLDGILFVDHLPLLKRKLIAKKLKALTKRAV